MNANSNFGLRKACSTMIVVGALSACGPDNSEEGEPSSSSSSGSQIVTQQQGYTELADGRDGVTYESVNYPPELLFDKSISLSAFKETVYPLLRENCASCHSTENTFGSGAQAPLHSDVDAELAHEHALTQVNFRDIHDSKLSTRLWIDRHNCFSSSCASAAQKMDDAISGWKSQIESILLEVPRTIPADVVITDREVEDWIANDKAQTSPADREFIQYATFHILHNEGVSAQDLNLARVGLSKALNSLARWAPEVVNPEDINGKAMVYRFDIRDYWGYTQIDTSGNYQLFYGGSDDDLAFGSKVNALGEPVSFADLGNMKNALGSTIERNEKYALLAWQRVLYGNVEGSTDSPSLHPNLDGFSGLRSNGETGQKYIKAEDLEYAEATQLTFTLTRPDVYNAIMAIPGYSHWLEDELGVDKSAGMDSFNYMIQYEAMSIDSRLYYRGKQSTGRNNYYWKAFDTFATQYKDIDDVYAAQEQNSPFWEAPVPIFISAGGGGGTSENKLTMIATRTLGPGGALGGGFFTGLEENNSPSEGQQSFESIIYSLPNGLQGYAIYGGFNQRRTDVFTNTIRDPRLHRDLADDVLDNYAGYGSPRVSSSSEKQVPAIKDLRLNLGSSCIGCHSDGIKRGNNDLRDWLDEDLAQLPGGDHGADKWIDDSSYVSRVKELYKPSGEMRKLMENDRRTFLETMGKIQKGMIIGPDKNIHEEPVIWSIEWAKKYYSFPATRST